MKRALSWEYIEEIESKLELERAISDNLQAELNKIDDFNSAVEEAQKIELRTYN